MPLMRDVPPRHSPRTTCTKRPPAWASGSVHQVAVRSSLSYTLNERSGTRFFHVSATGPCSMSRTETADSVEIVGDVLA